MADGQTLAFRLLATRTKVEARVEGPQVVRGGAHVEHAALHGQAEGVAHQSGGRKRPELEGPLKQICCVD